ncbi:MAG: hypothetical protein WBC88_10900 [Candidatus Zixiibacteriota bacterium]
MLKLARIVALILILIVGLRVPSSTAGQSSKTYVSRSESGNLGLLRSSTVLFAAQKADSVAARTPKSPKLKSPTTATIIAIFPGAAIHGLGHFYAGADSIAWSILAMEGLSIAIFGFCLLLPWWELAAIPCYCAAALFGATWWADMMFAAEAVKEHNKKVLEQQKKEFGFQFHQRSGQVGFRIVAGF